MPIARHWLLLSLCSALALAQTEKGRIVEITKATPVFATPQRAAKIVADADPGSAFTVLQLSPNRGWLYLMDEDGNKGWVPAQRTNYFVLDAPVVDAAQEKAKKDSEDRESKKAERRTQAEEKKREESEPPTNRYLEAKIIPALAVRQGYSDPNGRYGFGVKVYVNNSMGGTGLRDEKMGLEVGYFQMLGQKRGEAKGYAIPLRYKMLSRSLSSGWVSGPDLGLLFSKIRPPSERSFWKYNLSFGYSLGYNPVGSAFFVGLRPGAEILYHSRLSIEGNLSWLF